MGDGLLFAEYLKGGYLLLSVYVSNCWKKCVSLFFGCKQFWNVIILLWSQQRCHIPFLDCFLYFLWYITSPFLFVHFSCWLWKLWSSIASWMLATYDLFLYRKTNIQTYTSMNEYLLLKSYPLGTIAQKLTVETFQYTCIPTVMITLIEDILEWYWSSNVGAIAKHQSTTKVGPLVHQLLYSSFRGNRVTSWGLLQEEDTEKQYREYMKEQCVDFKVNGDCGLHVSTQYPWLAATRDGLVHDPSITPSRGLVEQHNNRGNEE